jgi:hypothetical protein
MNTLTNLKTKLDLKSAEKTVDEFSKIWGKYLHIEHNRLLFDYKGFYKAHQHINANLIFDIGCSYQNNIIFFDIIHTNLKYEKI